MKEQASLLPPVVVLVALAFVLAGCSGAPGNRATDKTTSPVATPGPADPTPRVSGEAASPVLTPSPADPTPRVSGEAASPLATPGAADPFEQNARLGRGVNLGNGLEAPVEGEWGVVLEESYFRLIQEAGFDSIRIPIRWSAHAAAEAPYTIEESFFDRVDWAVNQALSRDLLAVINVHHYVELFESPDGQEERFVALWRQIAAHYQAYPPDLLFELLNEPQGKLSATRWNRMLAPALAAIRETNPTRNVVVGPAEWNGIRALDRLRLPAEDRHIIVTFHYYEPFEFTHQGAEWVDGSDPWLGVTWEDSRGQTAVVEADMWIAAAWGEENGRPLYLGEFGAYSKADLESRALWTAAVARQAEEMGISWAYWEFCAGFGVYDRERGEWNEEIREALLPSP